MLNLLKNEYFIIKPNIFEFESEIPKEKYRHRPGKNPGKLEDLECRDFGEFETDFHDNLRTVYSS